MLTFTPSLFFQHATCPHWIWRDRYGDQRRKGDMPELAQKLLEQGVLHEEDYIKDLNVVAVDPTLGEAAYTETIKLMQQGAPMIYQGAIRATIDGIRYQGRPDLLEKVGDHYRPIDIKNSKELKQSHWLQLTVYALILEQIQGSLPSDCAIINSDHEQIAVKLTDTHIQKTKHKVAEILDVMQGNKPPLKLSSGCKQNPWLEECIREAEAADDIALIYNINSRTMQALRGLGYTTLHDLAKIDLGILPKIPYASVETMKHFKLQAEALISNRIHWLKKPHIPTAKLKIYFDIEGDPLLQVEYLFGFWIVEGNKPGKYISFLAEQPTDERIMWDRFVAWIRTLPKTGYQVYHFADYERSHVLSMAKEYGGDDALQPFVQRFIDLSAVVQESVIFPLYFYSIKDICKSKFLNYRWRHPKAGGAQSIFWYEKWLETGDRQVLQDIIDYNEDDVVATEYLHHWLDQSVKK